MQTLEDWLETFLLEEYTAEVFPQVAQVEDLYAEDDFAVLVELLEVLVFEDDELEFWELLELLLYAEIAVLVLR